METTNHNIKLPPEIFPYNGEWGVYLENIHQIFLDTLVNKQIIFCDLPVYLKKNPLYKDKSFTFWHLISEGEKEQERTPDFRRCERLSWIHWIIKNVKTNKDISCWENKRGSNTHVVIWFDIESYVIILAKRNGYYLLKTAYMVEPHRANTLRKEKTENKNYSF
ncbi:MAG: oxidoreductase [bacterium]